MGNGGSKTGHQTTPTHTNRDKVNIKSGYVTFSQLTYSGKVHNNVTLTIKPDMYTTVPNIKNLSAISLYIPNVKFTDSTISNQHGTMGLSVQVTNAAGVLTPTSFSVNHVTVNNGQSATHQGVTTGSLTVGAGQIYNYHITEATVSIAVV